MGCTSEEQHFDSQQEQEGDQILENVQTGRDNLWAYPLRSLIVCRRPFPLTHIPAWSKTRTPVPSQTLHTCVNMEIVMVCEITACNISKSTHLALTSQQPGFCVSNDTRTPVSVYTCHHDSSLSHATLWIKFYDYLAPERREDELGTDWAEPFVLHTAVFYCTNAAFTERYTQ